MSEQFAIMKRAHVVRSTTNPRTTFNQAKLQELATSIKESGVHQALLVRPLPAWRVPDTDRTVTHEIVCGERRDRACEIAGVDEYPVLIKDLTDDQVLAIQLVENLQRDDLTPLEEAEGYERLMKQSGLGVAEVAAKIGRSKSYVYGTIKLMELTSEGREALREGKIDASRALLLARIPDHKLQIQALKEITSVDWAGDPQYSYRSAAKHIQDAYMLRLDSARFKITDETLVPDAGSCKVCPKRTGHEPDLFQDVKSADVCTDPKCFHKKQDAHHALQLKVAHDAGQTVIEGREAKALMPNTWGGIEGYLRLDDKRDSPTDQPLRKLIGKELNQDGSRPTLIANPHKAGELIAVLPAAKVAELLKAKGHGEASEKVAKIDGAEKRAAAAAAKEKLKTDFEQGWRKLVLERTWEAIRAVSVPTTWPDLTRYLALDYAHKFNTDKCKVLCKLLDLGKVAPVEGLRTWVKEVADPMPALLLMIMAADVEYRHWLTEDSNEGLFMVARQYGIDIDAVKEDCKKAMAAKVSEPKKASPNTAQAALQEGGAGGGSKARTPKKKLTAEEATLGIAVAMQSEEQARTAAPETKAARNEALGVGLGVGLKVCVTDDVTKLRPKQVKYAGATGVIDSPMGDRSWWVIFLGKHSGMASFDQSELFLQEAVPA